MLIVVYGTLKKGYGNNRLLDKATFVTECIVDGFKLYNSGFPVSAVSAGESIKGEVWDIGDPSKDAVAGQTLVNLDRLEGCRDDDSSMYNRHHVVAYGDGSMLYHCDMYVGNPKYWREFNTLRECPKDENNNSYYWSR
jgi:gamma-glutamylcyclotransferase (GGCT)/AIG2-like uncharacterized protein YtfP